MIDLDKQYCIVLRAVNYMESDKMLTLFSRTEGLMSARARGVRKMKSKLKPAAQPLCCGEYEFHEKAGRFTLTGATIKQEFYGIQSDYGKFAAASVLLELTERTLRLSGEYERIFITLIYSLYAMEKDLLKASCALSYFFAHIADVLGIFPQFEACPSCGRAAAEGVYTSGGRFLCGTCAQGKNGIPLDEGAVTAIKVLLHVRPQKIEAAAMDGANYENILNALYIVLCTQLGTSLKTFDYFKRA